jgi:demethylmenaquinone methyltransferase/2-methoxy-6-polyprenyl-1,4-benzoquinol methylase
LHSFGTKHKLDAAAISHLPIAPGARILDVCAGSGDISIGIARLGLGTQITAFDASEAMLEEARRKAEGLEGIEYLRGDALAMPFENDTFDGAVISFGLRNLENLEAGLREMLRVVKPGGFVSNIDQGKPTNFLFRIAYRIYFYHVAPLIGKAVFHRGEFNSFRYLPESNRYFPDQRALVGIFEQLELQNVRNYDYWIGAVAQQVGLVPSLKEQ